MRKQLFKRRTLILFTLMFIGLSSMGYAQKVSLNSSQQSLKQVLESISVRPAIRWLTVKRSLI